LYSDLPKALITGITGQAGAGLTESLLTTGYALYGLQTEMLCFLVWEM
jgi:GDP-D-mannose dehydratase